MKRLTGPRRKQQTKMLQHGRDKAHLAHVTYRTNASHGPWCEDVVPHHVVIGVCCSLAVG